MSLCGHYTGGCSTQVLVLTLVFLERQKGVTTSVVLFMFWLAAVVMDVVPFYTYILRQVVSTKTSQIICAQFLPVGVFFCLSVSHFSVVICVEAGLAVIIVVYALIGLVLVLTCLWIDF